MKIDRILCPTNLSPESDEALRYAIAMARAYSAELVALHCTAREDARMDDYDEASQAIEAAIVMHAGDEGLQGLVWRSLVVACDDVGEKISSEAAKFGVDLIVMCSRRRPHRAALLGSTAESVSRTAPCPVLVIHSDDRDWVTYLEAIDLKRVLVAYDFSDHSELALNYGLSLAQEYQAELHLLHVLPPLALDDTEISWHPMGRENAYHTNAGRLQRAVPTEAHLWCEVKHSVREGNAYREILNYAEQHKIDLICIGAHGAGFGMRALFGSNVDRVLRQAPCPVLVTRPLKPATIATADREARDFSISISAAVGR